MPFPPDSAPYLALRDQWESAVEHARRYAAALITSGGGVLASAPDRLGPWAEAALGSVAPRPGRRRGRCEHLRTDGGPTPVFVLAPRVLGCYGCLGVAMDARMAGPERCDRCGRPEDTAVVVVQRDLVVAWGQLCRGCLSIELDPV